MPIIKSAVGLGNEYIEMSRLAKNTKQPIFLTHDGEGDMVLLTMEQYDEKFAEDELSEALEVGIRDYEAGRVKTFDEVNAILKATIARHAT